MQPSDGATDPTLTPDQLGSAATRDTVAEHAGPAGRHGRVTLPGYELGAKIGEGGMGEVVAARDARIGRDVAIKRMRTATPTRDAVDRFPREAKIQARLDHPAIVPVFELGHDADGLPYFTMKRLAGTTLTDVLAAPSAPLQRSLRAFVEVCLAVELAHTKGVVHRDLKPSNIMLGDFGEVYVLDWGVARVTGERADGVGDTGDSAKRDGHTEAGAMLGTPGYMAPEQIRGEVELGPAADVYALGAILFEILAGTSLHVLGHGALVTTLSAPQQSPAQRCPDRAIPPELDAVCVVALAGAPAARPTARELGERVQCYLDGDRDLEARRILGADLLARAKQAVVDPARRAEAVRLAGHALVLDPGSKEAAAQVITLLIEPPPVLPAELEDQLAASDYDIGRRSARTAVWSIAAYFGFAPFALWAGGVNWTLFAVFNVIVAFMVAHSLYLSRARRPTAMIPLFSNAILMILLSRVLGPWVLVPAVIGTFTASLVAQPELLDRPWLVISVGLGALFAPVVLEWAGVLSPTWHVTDGAVVMQSSVLHLGGASTIALLIVAHVALVLVNGAFGRTVARARRDAQRRVEIQAWHLRQLLPVETPRPMPVADGCMS